MKYNLNINQYAAVTNKMDVDIIDLAIFDFIKDFAHSPACMKIQTQEGVYFWVSHTLIMQEMPLLNIKTKAGIVKRIANLENAGLLKKHENCGRLGKTLYRFGPNYDKMIFNDDRVYTSQQKFRGVETKVCTTPNKSLEDNNIEYYNTEDNIERGENEFSPHPQATENNINPDVQNVTREFEPTENLETGEVLDATLFIEGTPKKEKVAKKRKRGTNEGEMILFADSVYYDFNEFEKCFQKPEFADVDILAYYHKVADWSSAGLNKKADWIAAARNWMRRDKEAGKLQTIKKESFEMDEGMKFYLNL